MIDGADARAKPIGQDRTVTGSWMLESCTEPRSLTTGFSGGTSSSVRSFPSSSSASARDFRRVWEKIHVIYSDKVFFNSIKSTKVVKSGYAIFSSTSMIQILIQS